MVLGLRARDKESIGAFWGTYYDKVFSICAAILGQGPDARDMTVDILVDFVENRVDTLSSSRAVYAFLRQTAVRRSIRCRDRRNRFCEMDLSDGHAAEGATPEERAELNQLMPLLEKCLGRLTSKAQTALRLKYTQKISNEKIGEIVGGSKSYIGRLLKQGRDTLRRCIENNVKQTAAKQETGGGWTDLRTPVEGERRVEKLLMMRPILDGDECIAPARMARALSEIADVSEREWATRHIEICAACRESFGQIDESLATELGLTGLGIEHVRSKTRLWKPLAAAAAVVVAFAAGILTRESDMGGAAQSPELSLKGDGDIFHAAAKRGPASFPLHPMEMVATGDRIGLFYSAEAAGYLAVFAMDDDGRVELLYPADETSSAAVSVGSRVPLKDGAHVGEGEGCEWLVAVFSDVTLDVGQIADAIERTPRTSLSEGCRLTPSLPGARSVRILPLTR